MVSKRTVAVFQRTSVVRGSHSTITDQAGLGSGYGWSPCGCVEKYIHSSIFKGNKRRICIPGQHTEQFEGQSESARDRAYIKLTREITQLYTPDRGTRTDINDELKLVSGYLFIVDPTIDQNQVGRLAALASYLRSPNIQNIWRTTSDRLFDKL